MNTNIKAIEQSRFFRNGATAKWSRPTEATVDDHRVDKAVNDHFRQAGPSLIKQEQRSQFMACWDPTVYHCSHQVWKLAIFNTLPLCILTILEQLSVTMQRELLILLHAPRLAHCFYVLI